MHILSRALGIGVLLLAAPLAAPSAVATPLAPYHLAGTPGHDALQPAGWSGHGHDRGDGGDKGDDRRRHWRHGHSWGLGQGTARQRWSHAPRFTLQPLPPRVVEHQLRRRHIHPIGRITLHRGVYLVPALDRHGRRVTLAVDPVSAVVLGPARHR